MELVSKNRTETTHLAILRSCPALNRSCGDSLPRVSAPKMETLGMTPESLDAVARTLSPARSRRAALAALLAVALPSRVTAEQRCRARASEDEILGFIAEAATEYGQSEQAMVRVARCESTLNPCARNGDGPYYGLFQYLKSTWRSTPYGDRDIYDPQAQALATGWMWQQGRKDEWVCK
jgi:hypothetical protein